MAGIELTSGSLLIFLKIIAIDIVLSGDNAVVIAMATRGLPKQQQNKAIAIGTAGAVLMRIVFAILIVYLLQIPLVHLIGGLLLMWIAYHVLVHDEPEGGVQATGSLAKAIGTIIVADATMSLDNVVAVAGAAKGHVWLLVLGVAISIPIMIFGSKVIVHFMEKHVWIVYVGAGVLAWTAGEMITSDSFVINLLDLKHETFTYMIIIAVTILVLLLGFIKNEKIAQR